MNVESVVYVLLIVAFLILSAFFSSSEAAFLSLQRSRLSHLVNSNVPGAKRVSLMIANMERLLSTILLGNNLVNVAFSAVITIVSVKLVGEGPLGVAFATLLGTVLLLIFGEIYRGVENFSVFPVFYFNLVFASESYHFDDRKSDFIYLFIINNKEIPDV